MKQTSKKNLAFIWLKIIQWYYLFKDISCFLKNFLKSMSKNTSFNFIMIGCLPSLKGVSWSDSIPTTCTAGVWPLKTSPLKLGHVPPSTHHRFTGIFHKHITIECTLYMRNPIGGLCVNSDMCFCWLLCVEAWFCYSACAIDWCHSSDLRLDWKSRPSIIDFDKGNMICGHANLVEDW